MKMPARFKSTLLLALTAMLVAGCSGKTEDVRIKLCREVTERLLVSMKPIDWQSQSAELRKEGDAAVRLGFFVNQANAKGRLITSTCYFNHNLPEDSAVNHVDPLWAFATLPYTMTIEGETVPKEVLNKAVRAEQLEPFVEFLDGLKKEIEEIRAK